MKKATTSLLIIILLIGGAAWYYVSFRLDDAITNGIEEAGSAAFGTSVKVGGVKTSIRDGTLSISSITVANPPGYNNKFAISLNAIEAAVDYDSFEIKRVIIDNPEVVIEEKGGQTNFSDLLVNIQSDQSEPAADADADADPDPDGEDGTDTDATTIVIRHFRMNQTRASFESKSLDRYSDLKVDEIEMNNISGTPSEVANLIATEIIKEITAEAAIELLKARFRQKFEKSESEVRSKLKSWLGGDDEDEDEDGDENDSDR
jgi:hypothetical protein